MSERYFVWGHPDAMDAPARAGDEPRAPRPPRTAPLPVRLAELLSTSRMEPRTLAWPRPERAESRWNRTTVA